MFRLHEVVKSYRGRTAIAPLSISIDEGEAVGVLGPSGSGKTTFLHLLGGVIQPDSGTIALNGHRLAELTPGRELSGLAGVIHQQLDLVPQLSVIHNVLSGRLGQWSLARSLVSLLSPRDRDLAVRALDRVGLADRLYERTSRLSGGEQQRVAIARLLVQDPRVMIADEPVSSLDPARARDLLGLLSGIARQDGKTLIASVHSTELATEFFPRLIGLRNGAVEFDLPARSVSQGMLDGLFELQGLRSETAS